MQYKALGRTGVMVSEIGLGCEGFAQNRGAQAREFLDAAEAGGVNYIDFYTADPQVRDALGAALLGRREKFVLQAHMCSVWHNGQYQRTRDIAEVKAGFEDLMRRLLTDHIEVGMIHYVDSMEDWQTVREGGVLDYARALKAAGKIAHIGLSSHNPLVALEAVRSGEVEVLMFSINPCYDLQPAGEDVEALWDDAAYERQLTNIDPDRALLYEECQRLGVGISVMKAFGGGDLLDETLSPAGAALTVAQCIHYALTRPAVATVLSGGRTVLELQQGIAYENASPEERDYATALAAFPKISWEGHCMYCGHCAPCPVGIDVAMVTKLLNLVKAQGSMPETVREHYAVLPHTGGECIACGGCERRCPFAVGAMENMRQAKEVFGK